MKHVTGRDGIGFLIISNTSRPYVILKKRDMMKMGTQDTKYHYLITYLMKTQEEYAREIEGIILRDVESCQGDWFNIDKEIFMQPENENKAFILGTRKTGCDLIILGGTNCDEGSMDWLFGSLGNENFYVCQPASFYKSQREIQKVNPLYAFKVATAYFREQGKVPVFEDSNCRLLTYSHS